MSVRSAQHLQYGEQHRVSCKITPDIGSDGAVLAEEFHPMTSFLESDVTRTVTVSYDGLETSQPAGKDPVTR